MVRWRGIKEEKTSAQEKEEKNNSRRKKKKTQARLIERTMNSQSVNDMRSYHHQTSYFDISKLRSVVI